MIKILSQLATEGNFLNLITGICKEPKANIVLHSARLNAFP